VGQFQCDWPRHRHDWVVSELRKISSALLGRSTSIAKPEDMTADLRPCRNAMWQGTADVRLRLWAPQGAQVEFVKQVAPTVEDLTEKKGSRAILSPAITRRVQWGDESRDYHV